MSVRRGYGDETWRLGREGDAEGLHRAADLLLHEPTTLHYEGHRARAFALAVEGRPDEALAQLNEGWTDEWPFPAAYAVDVARARFLAGQPDAALGALALAVRGSERLDGAVVELAIACVRRRPSTWTRALRVALAGGTTRERAGGALGVVRARLAGQPLGGS